MSYILQTFAIVAQPDWSGHSHVDASFSVFFLFQQLEPIVSVNFTPLSYYTSRSYAGKLWKKSVHFLNKIK